MKYFILYVTYVTEWLCVLCSARNKDNSWPEEIIAVMKEVRAKDKEKKDKQEGDKSDSGIYYIYTSFEL